MDAQEDSGERNTEAQRSSFGQAAALYDRIRPEYPASAVRWILGDAPCDVVDVGAGTGKLTRVLAAAGHRVTAVEPDPEMRAQLAVASPGVTVLAGSAERIPVRDGGADAVVAGQAFHWFDPVAAPAEIARVLRAGGVLAPVWNLRDESVPWVARLTELTRNLGGSRTDPTVPPLPAPFGAPEVARFPYAVPTTPDGLLDLMRSRSWYLTAPPDRQATFDRRVRELCAAHPELAGRDTFDLPYVTVAYRIPRLA
jgi:SAM-dependent methyltransferase